jgi:hypothetical protein
LASDEWLRDKEFQGLLTREEAAKLKEIASKIPKGAIGMRRSLSSRSSRSEFRTRG